MSVALILCTLLCLLVGVVLSGPYFETVLVDTDSSSGVSAELLDSKERLLRALKDLEQDFAMRKVEEDEFRQSKDELTLELAGVLKQIKDSE